MILDSATPWQSGIWFHRNKTPAEALGTRGHMVSQYTISPGLPSQEVLNSCQTVIFGRYYPVGYDPVLWMKEFKRAGKRVLYDIDDDVWTVRKHNPSLLVSSAHKDQYEELIRNCDAVTTPSPVLAKKIKKHFKKKVFLCPNAINYDEYKDRKKEEHDKVVIGYMGAGSHWNDISIVIEALEKLKDKYDFYLYTYGITGEPLTASYYHAHRMYSSKLFPEKNEEVKPMLDTMNRMINLRIIHKPFFPPEMHPSELADCDFDIGIAPLEKNEFNASKSNLKFYEYAATGTCCLASDVHPYCEEVKYRAKNTTKDWYKKLEKLIVDKKFRDKLQEEQSKWVKENRSIEKIALNWELACQLDVKDSPGVLNQK